MLCPSIFVIISFFSSPDPSYLDILICTYMLFFHSFLRSCPGLPYMKPEKHACKVRGIMESYPTLSSFYQYWKLEQPRCIDAISTLGTTS